MSKKKEPENKNVLFKDLVFYIEIYKNGENDIEDAKQLISQHGGKISKFLTKKCTHFVWQNGTTKSLIKAKSPDFKNMHIVTPEWILDSIEKGKISDYEMFKPHNLNSYQESAANSVSSHT